MDLPGFRSHVRYSVFKDRSQVSLVARDTRTPLRSRIPKDGSAEADGELSLVVGRCQPREAMAGRVPAAGAI